MKIVVHDGYEDVAAFVRSLPEVFESTGTTIYAARNVVKRFCHNGVEMIVKRYKRPNIVQRVAYTFFRPGKAERAYRYADMLLDRGLLTPEPIAYIEIKRRGLLIDSYFVSTVTDDRPLYPDLVETPDYDRGLADDLAAYMAGLHAGGVLHGDPNLRNILYHRRRDGSPTFTLIDTNRSIFRPDLPHGLCISNLVRLTHRRDLLRHLVSRYAECRGWDAVDTVRRVEAALDRFERRDEMKARMRRLLGHRR